MKRSADATTGDLDTLPASTQLDAVLADALAAEPAADDAPTSRRRFDTIPLPRQSRPDLDVDVDDAAADEGSLTLARVTASDRAREVYRLFLASEYAPALALANELIARGEADPMVVTIARECRLSRVDGGASRPFGGAVDGQTTLAELAAMTRMPLDDVLALLERLVRIGVLSVRPPA